MNEWSDFKNFHEPGLFTQLFSSMPFIFKMFFLAVLGIIAFNTVRGIRSWAVNNASPILMSRSRVIARRSEVWSSTGNSRARTNYYVTFEDESGNRLELEVPDRIYGFLVEGDEGELTRQGSRFKDFQRQGGRSQSRP